MKTRKGKKKKKSEYELQNNMIINTEYIQTHILIIYNT